MIPTFYSANLIINCEIFAIFVMLNGLNIFNSLNNH